MRWSGGVVSLACNSNHDECKAAFFRGARPLRREEANGGRE